MNDMLPSMFVKCLWKPLVPLD